MGTISTKSSSHVGDQKFFPSLNGFRAASILAVISSHCLVPVFHRIIFTGRWGVDFFFVISGFLITTLLMRELHKNDSISLIRFYIRRMLRIFPVALLYLIIMSFFNELYDLNISRVSFLTALLYIKNFPISTPGNEWYLGHYWTLSAEEQYYVFAPVLLSMGYVVFRNTACILIACVYAAVFLSLHTFKSAAFLQITEHVLKPQISLLLGSLSALLLHRVRLSIPPLGSVASMGLLISSLLIRSGLVPNLSPLLYLTIPDLCFVILIVSGIQNNKSTFYRIMNTRVLTTIGVLSYSLYIWQQIFTGGAFLLMIGNPIASQVFNLILLAIVSSVSYYIFERYFLRLKTRFSISNN